MNFQARRESEGRTKDEIWSESPRKETELEEKFGILGKYAKSPIQGEKQTRCGFCRELGHRRNKCPLRAQVSPVSTFVLVYSNYFKFSSFKMTMYTKLEELMKNNVIVTTISIYS